MVEKLQRGTVVNAEKWSVILLMVHGQDTIAVYLTLEFIGR